jgi:hypothetical protein
MKSYLGRFVLCAVAAGIMSTITTAQFRLGNNDTQITAPNNTNFRVLSPAMTSGIRQRDLIAAPGPMLQTFTRNITSSKDGNTYTYTIVGQDPFSGGGVPTNIQVPVIPIVFTFDSDGSVFDPTQPTSCSFGHNIDEATLNSPMFQPAPSDFFSNGVDTGATQYGDALQRAEFSSLIDDGYHTNLAASEPGTIAVEVGTSVGLTAPTGCTGSVGFIEINTWDFFVQTQLIPFVAANFGVTPDQFPVFLLSNVYWFIGNPGNCCVLGYHNAFLFGGSIQTYSPTTFDTSGIFGLAAADSAVPSHEIGEWLNDPYVNNATPAWGNIGQVSGCQGNFEVGDPLTGTQIDPVTMPNGFTYHLQELAFFSWYYNAQFDPSLGAGGAFSFNGTFQGPAMVCPPGGTF